MLTSLEFLMIITRAQFVTRSVIGLQWPFILMLTKKPLGLIHSVLWDAMWCSVIIVCDCLRRGIVHFSIFLCWFIVFCYAGSFWNSLLHIFCMISSLEIPCILKTFNSCICHRCICPFKCEQFHFSHLFCFDLLPKDLLQHSLGPWNRFYKGQRGKELQITANHHWKKCLAK